VDRALFEEMRGMEDEHWWLVGRGRILLSIVEQECERRGGRVERLLDVGSGTGAMLQELSRFADEAVGVETDPIPLAMSRERGLAVQEAPANDLPSSDESVDVLTAFDVLEHVPDDVGAAAEFLRVLRPGGVAIVSVPAYSWLWSGHDVVHGHHRRYTTGSLVGSLRSAGFDVRSSGYFNSFLLPVAIADRLAARVLRRPSKSDLQPLYPPLNAVLRRILLAERSRVLRGGFPAGLSAFAVAERPA
jgi:SAM-dependent methyltransferase